MGTFRFPWIVDRRTAMASMKDVARLANVSVMTASRAINGSTLVSRATAERVWRAVEELHYRPNLTARSLRINKSRLVGLLIPDIENPVFASLTKYVEEAANAKGYNVIVGNTWENPDREAQYLDIMIGRQVDGVILSQVSRQSTELLKNSYAKIPAVLLDRTFGTEMPLASVDNREAGALAADLLLRLGHRRFACLAGNPGLNVFLDRLEGYQERLGKSGVTLSPENIVHVDLSIASGVSAMEKILGQPARERPTAVFCANDLVAFGAIQSVIRSGLSVPGDISVIGVDNIPMSGLMTPPLTTIHQSFDVIAKAGFDLLHELIEGRKPEKSAVIIRPELVIRNSTAQVPDDRD